MGKTLYELTGDLLALQNLVESAVDEEGNPRELTEDEMAACSEWFEKSEGDFYEKADNYMKFIKNLRMRAENADSERANFKAEYDRLGKRAKAFERQADGVKGALYFNMDRLGVKKIKTDLFSANIQATQVSIKPVLGDDLSKVPEKYLKPRELDTVAIKQDIKDGILVAYTDAGKDGLEKFGKVFFEDGTRLSGVTATRGETLVIR